MPTCSIIHCGARKDRNEPNLTLHRLPRNKTLKQDWLNNIGSENINLNHKNVFVCSLHFDDTSFNRTLDVVRLRENAVPTLACLEPKMMSSNTLDVARGEEWKVCLICLAMDSKYFNMDDYNLSDTYCQLIGVQYETHENVVNNLCFECKKRLDNYKVLRDKALTSQRLLNSVLDGVVTYSKLKSIDRKSNNLESKLKVHRVENEDSIKNEYATDENNLTERDEVNTTTDNETENRTNETVFCEITNENLKYEHEDSDYKCASPTPSVNSSDSDSIPINQLKKIKTPVKQKKEKKVRQLKVKKVLKATEPKIDRRRKPFLNEYLNETLFTIINLTEEEQIAEIEKRRETPNYTNSLFKCTFCYKGFLDEDAYESHMVRHSDACGEFECKICKTHFKHPHALRKHITAHHTQRFNCNSCSYVTTHRQTARLHERWHKGTKYKCPHCAEEFLKFTTYMGHIRIKHPSDFVCELCGYSFVSAKGIELHKKLKHRLENIPIPTDGPQCIECDVKFVTEQAYKRHIAARHHDGNKDRKESNAPRRARKPRDSKSISSKERKERKRDGSERRKVYPSQVRKAEGPIPCEQCGMQLEDSRAYHSHFRRNHPDKNRTNYPSMKSPCMCEVCGRMFQSYALLKDHTWSHTGEKPFKCEQCPKSFRMKQRLVAHRRIHSQERTVYICSVCGKHFSTHSNRQRHMFIHTGLKPFKCEMCGKSFKHSSEKRAHVTYVHLKKPWPKRSRVKRKDDYRQDEIGEQLREPARDNMEGLQPIWACEGKMTEVAQIIEDKPMYYNIKM